MCRSPATPAGTSPTSARSITRSCSIYSTSSATRAGSVANTGRKARRGPVSAGPSGTAFRAEFERPTPPTPQAGGVKGGAIGPSKEVPMRILITGGCGFLGRRVALQLLDRREVDELMLFDNAPSALPLPEDKRLRLITGDIADRDAMRRLIAADTHAVFHLAAVVSGQAEADTDLGYRVNLDGTRAVLDACRALGTCPRVVFASSLAVYGGALPPTVGDDTPLTPQTSYGTQKAIGELLVNDYSRKGFVDGRALRLPTVV